MLSSRFYGGRYATWPGPLAAHIDLDSLAAEYARVLPPALRTQATAFHAPSRPVHQSGRQVFTFREGLFRLATA
jgi:hypothetical protein